MVVYAIYYLVEIEDLRFVGFLPERRDNSERMSRASILNFVKTVLGHEIDYNKISVFQVTLNERMVENIWPKPSIRTQEAI